jgi:hypothetical protein
MGRRDAAAQIAGLERAVGTELGTQETAVPRLRTTRAKRVESVSSKAVAKAFLGDAVEDVTDFYIAPGIAEARALPRECSSFGPRRHTRRHGSPGSSPV